MTSQKLRYKKLTKADLSKITLSFIFIVLVIVPVINMLIKIDKDSIDKVVHSYTFKSSIINSILVATISTLIVIIIAYILAMCIERSGIRFKKFFSIIFILPMLIPSISHGMGLTIVFGNGGLINHLFNIHINIYGMQGIIIGSVMYAFPVAFLMISDILKYEDLSQYEAATIMGISKFDQFKIITLPYLRKPLIAVAFASFTMIITDYGVPLMVGGKCVTIPVVMYQEVIGQLNFQKGAVYGALLLVPALISFGFDLFNKDKGNSNYTTKQNILDKSKLNTTLSYLYCILISCFVMLPIVAFGLLAFVKKYPTNMTFTLENFVNTFSLGANNYLMNSIVIAFFVSVIGICVAFVTAYLSARMVSKTSNFLHLSALTTATIPGIVLGLSYVLVFKSTAIYGTIIILIMVNLVHFLSSPYLMAYNSMCKINKNMEDVGLTLGLGRTNLIFSVFIPQNKYTIIEMFSYFFVNSMMTISAVSFLATISNKPIALMINAFEAQMQLEFAAVVSVSILGVNLLIKLIGLLLKKNEGVSK